MAIMGGGEGGGGHLQCLPEEGEVQLAHQACGWLWLRLGLGGLHLSPGVGDCQGQVRQGGHHAEARRESRQ